MILEVTFSLRVNIFSLLLLLIYGYFALISVCCYENLRERELQSTKKFKRRPPLRRGRVSPPLPVPDHIPKPPYFGSPLLPELASEYQIHNSDGIAHMRAACELAARVLDYAGKLVKVRLCFMREVSALEFKNILPECRNILVRVDKETNDVLM